MSKEMMDEDFTKWLKHEAKLRNEGLDNNAFVSAMTAKWMAAPIAFGKDWKEVLMVGIRPKP